MAQSAIDQATPNVETVGPITTDHLIQMVDDLFTSMLALDIDTAPCTVGPVSESDLSAAIRIDGEWKAAVTVLASPDLATEIACAMFAASQDELEESEVFDALGEIANVIGGNVKGIVDRDCNLSLPCVGPAALVGQPKGTCVAFELHGKPLTIVVDEG